MGTRCIFKVIETEQGRKKTIARVLSNYDGYPDGLPRIIFSWVKQGKLGNGIHSTLKEGDIFFNGAGDLAVQLIIKCKMEQCKTITEAGGIYLATEDDEEWVDFVYEIHVEDDVKLIYRDGGEIVYEGWLEHFPRIGIAE